MHATCQSKLLYHQGTLVCYLSRRLPVLEKSLPWVSWDEDLSGYRCLGADHPRLLQLLLAIPFAVDDRCGQADLKPATYAVIDLRPYQSVALQAWQGQQRRGVIVLPTGSGKTHLAIAAMQACRSSTLCLLPTRVLLQQWREVLARFYQGPVGIFGDGQQKLAAVTLATYQSASKVMPRLGNRFKLLVVDEAHHLGSAAWSEIPAMSTAPWRLGLTATPPSGKEAERLEVGMGSIALHISRQDLGGEYLAECQGLRLLLPLNVQEQERYDQARRAYTDAYGHLLASGLQVSFLDLARNLGHTPAGRRAMVAWHRARRVVSLTQAKLQVLDVLLRRHRQDRLLVFTADKPSTYAIAKRFLIMPITSDIARKERQMAIQAFCRGEIRALVSARVLNEGFDVPEAKVGIIVGSSQGTRELCQRVGRLLRKTRGKDHAILYQLVTRQSFECRQGSVS